MAEGISGDSKIVPVVGPCFSVLRLPCQGNSFSHTLISAGEFSAPHIQEVLSKVAPRTAYREVQMCSGLAYQLGTLSFGGTIP